jgi:hypothetical protein
VLCTQGSGQLVQYISHQYIDKPVSWATGVRLLVKADVFLFVTTSRPVLGSIQLPPQRVPKVFSPGTKRPRREADHSLPSSAEVKDVLGYTSTSPYVFMSRCLSTDDFTS